MNRSIFLSEVRIEYADCGHAEGTRAEQLTSIRIRFAAGSIPGSPPNKNVCHRGGGVPMHQPNRPLSYDGCSWTTSTLITRHGKTFARLRDRA